MPTVLRSSYQSYQGLTPVLQMIRMMPMWVTGVACNVISASFSLELQPLLLARVLTIFSSPVALVVARIDGFIILGMHLSPCLVLCTYETLAFVVIGCTFTSLAPLLFALIKPEMTYWAFGFPAATFSVFGADL